MASEFDLDAIEQRANAATEGPWVCMDVCEVVPHAENDGSRGVDGIFRDVDGDCDDLAVIHAPHPCDEWEDDHPYKVRHAHRITEGGIEGLPADFQFIAHARTDIPALIARVRELEAALAKCAAHTAYLPGAPRELLEGLLASIRRIIADAAKGLADGK